MPLLYMNAALFLILFVICLVWHVMSAGISTSSCITSCTDADTKDRVKKSNTLSFWLMMLSLLMLIGICVAIGYNWRKKSGMGMPDSNQDTPM